MYEVLDKIYVASIIEEATENVPEIVQISKRPLFERSSVFIAESTPSVSVFDCMKKNAPEMYKCDNCGFKVYLKVNLKIHMEVVHRLGIPISMNNFCSVSNENYNMANILKCYICENCDFATHSLIVLYKHQLTHHRLEKKKPPVDQIIKSNSNLFKIIIQPRRMHPKSNGDKQFKCGQCTFTTTTKYYLKQHIQIKHRLPEDDQLYECDKCYFKTVDGYRFATHKLRHDRALEMELLKCNFCDYTTKRKHHLSSHILYKHTPEEETPKFNCSYCPYWTKYKASLNEHVLVRHTSEENINWFICEMCPFKCKTKTGLRMHMFKHSENRFLLCEVCSKQFKHKGSLKKHMISKHKVKM